MFRPGVANVAAVTRDDKEITLELDSHADTYVLGNRALVVADFSEPVNVQGYYPTLGTNNHQTITGTFGYCDTLNRNSFHLVIHQAIYIHSLYHHLLCPMKCRMAVVGIDDCPKFLTTLPQENFQFVISKDEY